MGNKFFRKKYLNTNKYQRRIIVLTIFPTLVICALVTVALRLFHGDLVDLLLMGEVVDSVNFINERAVFILTAVWTFFVLVAIWSFVLSLNLVGAFLRIIKELDDVIEGKDQKKIIARENDELANELLKRVNILISHLPQPRKKLDR